MKAAESLSDGLEKLEQIVRPLEWYSSPSSGMRKADTGETGIGTYRVWTHHEAPAGEWYWHLSTSRTHCRGTSEAECMAAAEADYRARIASALNLSSILSEIKRMREIISECAEALGNGAYVSPSASIDFMAKLPGEIRLHLSTLSPQDPTNDRK